MVVPDNNSTPAGDDREDETLSQMEKSVIASLKKIRIYRAPNGLTGKIMERILKKKNDPLISDSE